MLTKLAYAWSVWYRKRRKPDIILGANKNPPYMQRWWIIPRNRWFNAYLHEVGQDDEDRALHDHPWDNMSWVLHGGFIEVTEENGETVRRARLPGAIKRRRATDAHRLELIGDSSVSLFFSTRYKRKWGFHCPRGWIRYEEFVGPMVEIDGSMVQLDGKGCGEDDRDEQVRREDEAVSTSP